ncbi:hypothetical protein C8Q77DRAFT_1061422 [Trametes polyzona]|nr:hypothetical protein C8Q77DRAFT_1061422 [Trametes polyzona]
MLLSTAALFSTSFEGILYGLSVFLFILTLFVLLRNRRKRRVNWAMVCASTALLMFSTMEMVVNIIRLYEGFVAKGPAMPDGAEEYFGDVSQVSFVLKTALYNVQTLILDGVVIFRTFKVWNSIWVVVIPILGWLGLLGERMGANIGRGLGYSLSTTPHISEDIFEIGTTHWFTVNWSMTLITNICSTLALAYRIWQVTSKSAQYRSGGRLSPILRIIVESGALYSITVTAALVLFLVRSNGVYVILDMISPIICIVFNMIIVRIGLAADGTLLPEPTEPVPAPIRDTPSRAGAAVRRMVRRQASGTDLEMKDINITVEISQFVAGDQEYYESRFSRDSEEGPKSDCIGGSELPGAGDDVVALPSSPTRTERTHDGGLSVLERSISPIPHNGSQIHVVAL